MNKKQLHKVTEYYLLYENVMCTINNNKRKSRGKKRKTT